MVYHSSQKAYKEHTIEKGENLLYISKKYYGDSSMVKEIMKLNMNIQKTMTGLRNSTEYSLRSDWNIQKMPRPSWQGQFHMLMSKTCGAIDK